MPDENGRVLTRIVGNESLKKRLATGITAEVPEISHAYVIEGRDGIGKHTLALNLAAALCCEHRTDAGSTVPCGTCASCRKIFAGISPDVIEVTKEDKASLGVDSIRFLREDVHIFPNDLERKIYIINDADTMTVQAQNAFLLTLEEPPAYAMFFLLVNSAHELLSTVQSRAPVLRMQPLTTDEVIRVVLDKVPGAETARRNDPEGFAELAASAGGCAGRAMELLSAGGNAKKEAERILFLRKSASELCRLCADRRKETEFMIRLLSDAGNTRDGAGELLEVFRTALRDLAVLKRDADGPVCFFTDREKATELSDAYSLRRLLALCDLLSDALEALERNMNVRLTLMKMISSVKQTG